MSNKPKSSIQEVYQKAVEKAAKDDAFRNRLISNPHAAIKELTGVEVPKHYVLKTVEQPLNGMLIVIPGKSSELSNAELESVAGGSKSDAADTFGGLANGLVGALSFGQWHPYSPNDPNSAYSKAGEVVGSTIPGVLV